jgi:hypothetical protein
MAKFERRESEIVDIFDTCIDRLMAGEALDTVLADYPDYADELRSLLETGLLVQQVQSNGASADEVSAAQQQGRDKVVAALGSLPETEVSGTKRRPRILQWVAMAAAAAFAMGFGITLGVSNSLSAATSRGLQAAANEVAVVATSEPPIRMTDVFGASTATTVPTRDPIIEEATRIVGGITQTAAASVTEVAPALGIASTPTAALVLPSTPTALPTMTVTATVTATVTFTPTGTAEPRATATAFPTLAAVVEESGATGVLATATSLARLEEAKRATVAAGGPTFTPMPPVGGLPTAGVGGDGGGSGDAGVLDSPSGGGAGDPVGTTTTGTLLIPTEVASFYAMTPTLAPMSGEAMPVDGTSAGSETDVDGYEAFPPIITDGETSSELPPPQPQPLDYRNVELQPLKAGEIDDNADWDTYTEFRRNYLAMMGSYGVIDLDVGGRQIIKIVDSAGKPILGAKVRVYSGGSLIAETTTYATGMTLFFPNADPAYSRMDTFRVVVSKNGVTFETMLDIKRLDDTLTITLQ